MDAAVKRGFGKKEVSRHFKKVAKIVMSFRHPIVYDDKTKQLIIMNNRKFVQEQCKTSDLPKYIGQKFDSVEAFVKGELDFESLLPRPSSGENFEKIFKFIEYVPDIKQGRLNNLCDNTLQYKDFDEEVKLSSELTDTTERRAAKCRKTNQRSKRIGKGKGRRPTASKRCKA